MITVTVDWQFLLVTTIVPVILLFIPLVYIVCKVHEIAHRLRNVESDTVEIRHRTWKP